MCLVTAYAVIGIGYPFLVFKELASVFLDAMVVLNHSSEHNATIVHW